MRGGRGTRWTDEQLAQVTGETPPAPSISGVGRTDDAKRRRRSPKKTAERIREEFYLHLEQAGAPRPRLEYRFHPTREWRFDYCWPEYRLALEVEGGVFVQGRHTRGIGFVGDMQKYNCAVMLGWRILRVTPQQLERGLAARMVSGFINVLQKSRERR